MSAAEQGSSRRGLLVCAPLRIEAHAVRRGLTRRAVPAERTVEGTAERTAEGAAERTAEGTAERTAEGTAERGAVSVARTGFGPRRSARRAAELARQPFRTMAVTGLGGALDRDLRPGEIVVATEVRADGGDWPVVECPSAPLLAGELRRAGLAARTGPVVTTAGLVHGPGRQRLAATGALVADMESAPLAAAAGGRPVAVLRAVSDGPGRPLLHPATVSGGVAALRALHRAGPVLRRWGDAAADRKVLLAGPRSFCAGVERAIEIVERVLARHGPPVYVRRQIVHNAHVVGSLADRGAVFVEELDEVPDGCVVVFSAHGVAPAVRAEAARRGLEVVDATCPLVAKVHTEARRFADQGYQVVLIGHAGHDEVEGTLGEAPGMVTLAETAEDVDRLRPADGSRVAYLMQTTLAVEEARSVQEALQRRFPSARGPGTDDICYATTNRQQAIQVVAADADLVLVVGSANSSNSVRLVETARRAGPPAYLIEDVAQIQLGWLAPARVIGLTAGASAPPALVNEVIAALRGLGRVEVEERVIATESVSFSLPKEVRPS
ncbi:MAG TPA: 4-hydroxy-3-methylbut-2-enyl diphosphate reductase [Streptosporangiaceae bacterium]|nr:4-hydroxy-3-methylbut-2-enyl diphosphate reductase [Streptosporangiaceae bacterium]